MIKQIFKTGLKYETEYKFNILFKFVFNMLPAIITFFIWNSVYTYNDFTDLSGISYKNMIGYILLTNIIYSIIKVKTYDISRDIRGGIINNYLLKPIGYFKYKIIFFLSKVCINLISYIIPITIILLIFNVKLIKLTFFIILFLIAVIMNFLINYVLSLLTFWLMDISGIFALLNFIIAFFAGNFLPLDIMPKVICDISKYLPFKYLGYEVTASIFTYTSTEQILNSILIGGLWVIILLLISKLLWKVGIKRYGAYGG